MGVSQSCWSAPVAMSGKPDMLTRMSIDDEPVQGDRFAWAVQKLHAGTRLSWSDAQEPQVNRTMHGVVLR